MTARVAKPKYFKSGPEFRAWLETHHNNATELLLGFYKKTASRKGITYPEALDEALAFGWIDGVRRGVDEDRYTIRFTPRKPRSIWSNVNIKRVGELTAAGRMAEPGLATFAKRDAERSGIYSYELAVAELDAAAVKALEADAKANAFHSSQPPAYRRLVAHWLTRAKKSETRARRLATLIARARVGKRIPSQSPKEP
jgi:uncharacterized protein YdeI (YjbR/CyaY-like superfamily)